jgi:cell division protein FtsQ
MIRAGSTRLPPRLLRSLRHPPEDEEARRPARLLRSLRHPPEDEEARRPARLLRSLRPPLGGDLARLPPWLRLPRMPAFGPRTERLLARVRSTQLRTRLTVAAAVPLVVIGGWLLLRDSGLFSVDRVAVSGLGADALPVVSDDLLAAARRETTTDFSLSALREAVAPYTVIAGISAKTHFPHGLSIEVVERHPVAHLQVGKHWYLLDANGLVITGARGRGLTVLRSSALPKDGRSHDRFVLLALGVLAAAPAPLRARVVAVTVADGLLMIYLHRGPRLIFGNAALPHAKWDAAAAVLADPSSRGASYINVQVPSRPAAQVADPATTTASTAAGANADAPTGAASVSTLLDPALVQPSSYTSG